MKPVRITPRADRDIDACFSWIKKDNPAAALRFLDAMDLTCTNLSEMPRKGSTRYSEIALVHGVRVLPVRGFENHLLFYMEHEATVDIIRLLHSARDIPEALQG